MVEAVILILEKDSKVIFAKRSSERKSLPGKWSLPAGKIEKGENYLDAAVREAKEELDLEIYDLALWDSHIVGHNSGKRKLYFIKAKYKRPPRITALEELTDLKTFTFEDFFKRFGDQEVGTALRYLRKKFKRQMQNSALPHEHSS